MPINIYKTEPRFIEKNIRNDDYLYIGIRCFDSPASEIIANEMCRDALIDNDDNFELILDTFHDHRNGDY